MQGAWTSTVYLATWRVENEKRKPAQLSSYETTFEVRLLYYCLPAPSQLLSPPRPPEATEESARGSSVVTGKSLEGSSLLSLGVSRRHLPRCPSSLCKDAEVEARCCAVLKRSQIPPRAPGP
ncbi:hypothetical protein mRhiFer1_008750 [Rhinolophus ferrumequinum]|uniref:Uncharacterized protein n=1 Tax=Rhinolophus ferrumequinum TaxID=59479 RepID=A0A7J7TMS3_RHIFE|nr:hypothetical protein mRhiFer1_008750 [Rhinolophus ferrumequinum]